MAAGDRFGVLGAGIPLSEGIGDYEQQLTSAFGLPVVIADSVRDGVGITPEIMGGVTQSQTIGIGDGSTKTGVRRANIALRRRLWRGSALFHRGLSDWRPAIGRTGCGNDIIDPGRQPNLQHAKHVRNRARRSRARNSFSTRAGSNRLPDRVLEYSPSTDIGSPSAAETWSLTCSGSCSTTAPTRADPPGGAPWPSYNIQGIAPYSATFVNGFGTQLIQAGTFEVSVNGTPFARTRARSPGTPRPAIARARASHRASSIMLPGTIPSPGRVRHRSDHRVLDEHRSPDSNADSKPQSAGRV